MATVTQGVFELALQHHQAGRLAEAERLYRQVLARMPDHAEALHHLGIVACQVGRFSVGAQLIRSAIGLRPNWPLAYDNLGKAFFDSHRADEAIAAFRQAITLKPDFAEAHNSLGNALRARGELDAAVAAYRQAIILKPAFADAHHNLGNALRRSSQFDAAITAYRRAIALKPDFAAAHSNLGNALMDTGALDDAVAAHQMAIALRPGSPEAHNNLGFALRAKGHIEEAIAACRQAIALKPGYYEAYNNLGNALWDIGKLDEAIAAHRHAIALNPNCPDAYSNLGNALSEKGQVDESIVAYRAAISLKPDHPEANYNLASMLLLQGDFPQGWAQYEWRWRASGLRPPFPVFAQPQWDCADLTGRTLLLSAEQGIGDTLQMMRYVPLAAERAGRVIVTCQPELLRLLQCVPGVAQWRTQGEPPPRFDLHCPLLSLPMVFGTTLQTIPRTVPYLSANSSDAEVWRQRINSCDVAYLRVGLAWSGSPGHKNDRNRSLLLSQLAPLGGVQGAQFFSLQKGGPAGQAIDPSAGLKPVDWTNQFSDFADTAALIANLDLVISVDTAVAHLAGAMGKPVWTLLAFVPDWRWLLNRDDSPWYPTMRLFRQPALGDWESVVREVARALRAAVQGRAATPEP